MFKLLFSIRVKSFITALLRSNRLTKNGKKNTGVMALFAFLFVYCLVAFCGMFFLYFVKLAEPFHSLGIDWFYFTSFALVAFALMFVGSVFAVKSQLFESKDNDLLLSMPIPPKTILFSRLLILLIINYLFEIVVGVPAIISYEHVAGFDFGVVAIFVLIFLFLPLIALTFSTLIGWLLSLITSRVSNKAMITNVFSILFLAAYFYLYSKASTIVGLQIQNGERLADRFQIVSPLYWLGQSIAGKNIGYAILTVICLVVPFVLTYMLLSATFITMITTKHGAKRKEYKAREMNPSPVYQALFNHETSHFFASSPYLLNCGLGSIVLFGAGVFTLVKKQMVLDFLKQIPGVGSVLPYAIIIGLCLLISLCLYTAPSISIEGKTLWLLQSLPIKPVAALNAKLMLHLVFTLPFLLFSEIVMCIATGAESTQAIGIILVPVLFDIVAGILGLIINIKHPSLEWINETQAVKNSLSVFLTMMLFWFIIVLMGLAFFFLPELLSVSGGVILVLISLLLIIIAGTGYAWLYYKGSIEFMEL